MKRLLCNLVLKTLFGFHVEGRDHIPANQPLILAGNHAGLLDGLMITAAYPGRLRFLVKEEVLSWPVAGKIVKHINPIIVTEGREIRAIREAVRALKNNQTLCIFPEGKLSRDGTMAPFKSGVGLLQKLSGAPILPFTLQGSYRAWPWGRWLPRLFTPLTVCFAQVLFPVVDDAPDAISARLKTTIGQGFAA